MSDLRVDLGRRWDLWVHVLTQAWPPRVDVWPGLARIAVRGELDMRQTGGQGSPAMKRLYMEAANLKLGMLVILD